MTLNELLKYFQNPVAAGNGYNVNCPAHQDNKASLSVTSGQKGVLLKCQAGCLTPDIVSVLGLQMADLFFQPVSQNGHHKNGTQQSGKKWQLVESYQYQKPDGSFAFEVQRMLSPKGKEFPIRWKNDSGEWVNGTSAGEYFLAYGEWWRVKPTTNKSLPRCQYPALQMYLYKLPELLKSDYDDYVFIVEGEKDVDRCRSLGLIATTNPQGAGKWRQDYNQYFENRIIVIIPDNDPPPGIDASTGKPVKGYQGQIHAKEILAGLNTCKNITALILELPGLPIKGDISDWFDAGNTTDQLRDLVEQALTASQQPPPSQPSNNPPPVSQASGQPQKPNLIDIDITLDHLPTLNALCWQAIGQQNKPPVLFNYGSTMIRTRYDFEDDSLILDPVTVDVMRHELSHMAEWRKEKNAITKPPIWIVKDVMASRSIPLPRLNRVVTVPVFAPDGTLQTTVGYNQISGVIYAPPKGYQSLAVPTTITSHHLDEAKDIIEESIQDFPFASGADKCNAIALFLLPFVRDMIDGPTPLHLIEASMPGSGKGLLALSLLHPGLGKIAGAPQPRDDEELRKFITSELIACKPIIYLDNISRLIDSGAFAAALTLETWSDRILGSSATANVKIKSIWLATGNNVTISTEIARRTIRIRLTPQTDRPEEREDFLHEDQIEWIAQNRPKLVWAAHILCQFAIQQKLPRPKIRNVGSFERWSRLLGSILECAGYSDFLGNYRALQDGSDIERTALSLFCMTAWEWLERENKEYATNEELLQIADGIDSLEFRGNNDKARQTSFGRWIKSKNEVITEYVEDDPNCPFSVYRLKILSGIAGKSTNRGKSVTKIECIEKVPR